MYKVTDCFWIFFFFFCKVYVFMFDHTAVTEPDSVKDISTALMIEGTSETTDRAEF